MVSPILGIGRLRGESRRDVSLRRPVVPALRQWPKQGDHDENDERLDQDRDIGAPGVLQTRSGELTSVEKDVCDPQPSNGAEQRSSRQEHPSSPTSHPREHASPASCGQWQGGSGWSDHRLAVRRRLRGPLTSVAPIDEVHALPPEDRLGASGRRDDGRLIQVQDDAEPVGPALATKPLGIPVHFRHRVSQVLGEAARLAGVPTARHHDPQEPGRRHRQPRPERSDSRSMLTSTARGILSSEVVDIPLLKEEEVDAVSEQHHDQNAEPDHDEGSCGISQHRREHPGAPSRRCAVKHDTGRSGLAWVRSRDRPPESSRQAPPAASGNIPTSTARKVQSSSQSISNSAKVRVFG